MEGTIVFFFGELVNEKQTTKPWFSSSFAHSLNGEGGCGI
jgi:hypothetical protein